MLTPTISARDVELGHVVSVVGLDDEREAEPARRRGERRASSASESDATMRSTASAPSDGREASWRVVDHEVLAIGGQPGGRLARGSHAW